MSTAALNAKATEIENKIPEITNLATENNLNKKATEVESKIPDITNLATNAALNTKVHTLKKSNSYHRFYYNS